MTRSVRRVHARLHTIQGPRNVRILHQHSRECPPSEEVESRAEMLMRAYIMDRQPPCTAGSEGISWSSASQKRSRIMSIVSVSRRMECGLCVRPAMPSGSNLRPELAADTQMRTTGAPALPWQHQQCSCYI